MISIRKSGNFFFPPILLFTEKQQNYIITKEIFYERK